MVPSCYGHSRGHDSDGVVIRRDDWVHRGGLADDPRKNGLVQPDSKSQKSCDGLGVEELRSDSLIMFEAFSSHASWHHPFPLSHECPTVYLAQEGDRLKYQLLKGDGPPTGWVSLTTGGKQPLGKPIEAVSWRRWQQGPFFSWSQSVYRNLGRGFKYVFFHPYLGKIPILTNIFQRGWNHQLVAFHIRLLIISEKVWIACGGAEKGGLLVREGSVQNRNSINIDSKIIWKIIDGSRTGLEMQFSTKMICIEIDGSTGIMYKKLLNKWLYM